MKIFKNNRNLLIIALVVVVNALGYGIIIPILYSYSQKYGLTDFQNGLLFALFSICQFLSTPIIGRLSDKYGRKPLLIISISGTALSFFMTAFAPNALFLFIARALDGITAGNIPVASAVISDTTSEKDRAKGFGIIGASFGFGFIFGPAISAATVGISESIPFIIAGAVSLIAVVTTALFLPETNKHIGQVAHSKLFDFGKMFHALFDKNVGLTLLITLFYFSAFSMFIYAFQPYSVKDLNMSPNEISFLFTIFGAVGLFSQIFIVPRVTRLFGLKNALSISLISVAVIFSLLYLLSGVVMFFILSIILGLTNTIVYPLIQTILSEEADAKSQGTMQGLNASYMSIGQIIGPILGGIFASFSIRMPFLTGSAFVLFCLILSLYISKPGAHKESAF